MQQSKQEIIDEVVAKLQSEIGPHLNTEPTSILGQLIDTFADQMSQDWDVMEKEYRNNCLNRVSEALLEKVGTDIVTATAVLWKTDDKK